MWRIGAWLPICTSEAVPKRKYTKAYFEGYSRVGQNSEVLIMYIYDAKSNTIATVNPISSTRKVISCDITEAQDYLTFAWGAGNGTKPGGLIANLWLE